MYQIKFTPRGERAFRKLPQFIQKLIKNKLFFYASQEDPLKFAKPLINLPPSTHRFRIGKYRASFFVKEKTIFIEEISIRGKAYRRW
ncbi:hypothetical protein COT65_01580 [Candidatus Shapirobacteria bacterium CG09_land_8_20_14_0_10_47_13]|uniref:Type II toxin-antitoxin system RelE/ParE family toxin n=1 Tax=Candidatus Shapirobacteria bacterium CG09_land_8_20_14_0_10_47_13 TaxID=1974481 RepID=A0A2H0WMQ1_9BACT|nr:MAG: hypothetical protein COT65_01580 [Candidatus Shapirobacteria bacterium CG09_land_8_20_14_0_10_47_13]